MIELVKYNPTLKNDWNNLVSISKNGTFLFHRDYMDYHSKRFNDFSLIFKKKNKCIALLPGNILDATFYSHQGLTYGGLILSKDISLSEVHEIFDLFITELKSLSINSVVYKTIPYIYHQLASQEDLYELFQLKAEKIACNISSTIFLKNRFTFTESRKSGIRKAKQNRIEVTLSKEFEQFWNILENTLNTQHSTKPVHSIEEIIKLADFFPENIKLYVASKDSQIIAGTVLFESNKTIHVQYISANLLAKELGALDIIFDCLVNNIYPHFDYFDFGHSCENNGYTLNKNLIFQKEGFGGRGVIYDIYKFNL